MPYTPHKPALAETPDQLRARIPGWGVDLDPADRPSVPKLQFQGELTGAHWEFPERQPEKWPRERSIEHQFLTPVFGTAQPPRGLSGAIRKLSYGRYSEGRLAHEKRRVDRDLRRGQLSWHRRPVRGVEVGSPTWDALAHVRARGDRVRLSGDVGGGGVSVHVAPQLASGTTSGLMHRSSLAEKTW